MELYSIEIAVGRIRLMSVEMRTTYGGLIEGAPNAWLNDRKLERLVKNAQRHELPVHLVPPERTQTGRKVELLPPVECVGRFEGPPTSRLRGEMGDWWTTALRVIWFQEQSDSIIHPAAAARMHDLPWDELAQDFTFDDW